MKITKRIEFGFEPDFTESSENFLGETKRLSKTFVAVHTWLYPRKSRSKCLIVPPRFEFCLLDRAFFQLFRVSSYVDALFVRSSPVRVRAVRNLLRNEVDVYLAKSESLLEFIEAWCNRRCELFGKLKNLLAILQTRILTKYRGCLESSREKRFIISLRCSDVNDLERSRIKFSDRRSLAIRKRIEASSASKDASHGVVAVAASPTNKIFASTN